MVKYSALLEGVPMHCVQNLDIHLGFVVNIYGFFLAFCKHI